MSKKIYNWKYIKQGAKIWMILCRCNKEIEKTTDITQAFVIQKRYKDELENNILEFAIDQRDKAQARIGNRKYDEKTNFIKQAEWNKIQDKLKKSKQTGF